MIRNITTFLIELILVIWGVFSDANILFIILMVLWVQLISYSIYKLESRVILLAFGISFFIFLLGREFLEQYRLFVPDHIFKPLTDKHVYICLNLSLISVWAAYALASRRIALKNKTSIKRHKTNRFNIGKVRHFSLVAFYITYPFAIIISIIITYFVARFGYSSYYIDFSEVLSGSPLLYLFSKLELVMESAFCIFLATFPPKKQFRRPGLCYIIYLALTLGSGQRSSFLLGLMLLFIFLVLMNGLHPSENWFKRKYIVYCAIAFPIVAVGASLFNAWRFHEDYSEISFWKSFGNFFYEQGVTSYIIKHAYELEKTIPPGTYTMEFLHSGVPAQLLGYEVYHGNTVDHAVHGGSFTHALGYTVMGKAYLAGRGTGSSYIAELYYDFGYIGVILGSMLYGWLFSKVNNIQIGGVFQRSIIFICIPKLLWALRASFTGFLSYLSAPTTIALLLFVFLNSEKSRNHKTSRSLNK